MADPFADMVVRINDRPIYCMGVKGALCPGNWVLFRNGGSSTVVSEEANSIGLILSTSEDGDSLEVNLFRRVTPEITRDLELPRFTDPRYAHIPQIVRTSSRVSIDWMRVKSICWVFQRDFLDCRPYDGYQGMKNLFLLEFNDEGGRTHIHGCHPFCSRYGNFTIFGVECYQERVWNGLQMLRAEIGRHLARYSEKQGSFNKVSSQVFFGREAWQYLLSVVENYIRSPTGRIALVSKRVLVPGLLLKAHQTRYYSTMIRFETEDELRALSSVLGELATIDVRKRRPKYSIVESLFLNDIANVVAGSQFREEPFQVRTNMQGIDLLYDGTKVRIRMRYQRYQYNLPLADGSPTTILTRAIMRKRPLGPGEDASDDEDNEHDLLPAGGDEATVVVIGRQFDHLNRIYQLVAINLEGGTVSAKVFWPSEFNERVDEFEYDNVLRLIRAQLVDF
jgi:hypothetical protein